jgi:hypothetical protein
MCKYDLCPPFFINYSFENLDDNRLGERLGELTVFEVVKIFTLDNYC